MPETETKPKKRSKLMIAMIAIVALIGILLIAASRQPDEYSVSRSATMAAPASAIFTHVNTIKKWEAWNPWGKLDPNMKLTYDGPSAGVGASYSWEGNNQVGSGKMTVTESKPDEAVRFRLDMYKPMAGTSDAAFTFKPEGDKTTVTWSMSGKCNLMSKVMGLFMSMDKMIGDQFEKGLADLKTIVETEAKK
ncbi:MAG TPA: SRPBCC family protein [Verrucomicrobiae bacterium]